MELLIMGFFLTLTLIVGLYNTRSIKTFRDYVLGNEMSTFTAACSLVATVTHASTLGEIFDYHTIGFKTLIAHLTLFCVTYFGAKVFIVRMSEFLGHFSVAESIGMLYGPIARKITAFCVLTVTFCTIVAQFKIIFQVVHFVLPKAIENDGYWFATVTGFIVILYASLGGAKSIAMTDVFQLLCFGCTFPIVGFFLLYYSKIPITDGWANLIKLPQFADDNYLFSRQSLEQYFFYTIRILGYIFSPIVIQKFYMAKSVHQGKKIFTSSAAVRFYIHFSILAIAITFYLGGHVLKSRDHVVGYLIDLAPFPGIKPIIGITVLALLMSTVDSALHLLSILIVHDILPSSLFEGVNGNNKKLKVARLLILLVGIVSLYSALAYKGNIYKLMARGSELYVPVVTVPLAISILGFRTRRGVVLMTMLTSLVFTLYSTGLNIISGKSIGYHEANIKLSITMGISFCTLIAGHYLFPKLPNTGWVSIKDRSLLDLQTQETKRWWLECFKNLKLLFTHEYRFALFPKKEQTFVFLGFYMILNSILSLWFMLKYYIFPYCYWHITIMAIGTTIVSYPTFPSYKLGGNKLFHLAWPVLLFFSFFIAGIEFAKLSHFSLIVCALFVLNFSLGIVFLSFKLGIAMFLIAIMLHTFIPPNPPFCNLFCSNAATISPTNLSISVESFASILLVVGILPALLLYKYLHDKARVKEAVIELARAYERRSSLEAYNQVNWARLDPSHGSKMLREMGKILDKPCQYLYAHGEQKLAESVDIFIKKLREFSNLLLRRAKEERSLELNEKSVQQVYIEPVILKVCSDIRRLEELMQLLLYNRTNVKQLIADPGLFERLLTINLLEVSKTEQAPNNMVTLTITDTTLRYDYAKSIQSGTKGLTLKAIAFFISTDPKVQNALTAYDIIDEITPIYLPKTEAQLYQAESRQIVQAHGGYVEIVETEKALTCLYVLPIAGKNVMRFKTYDPATLASDIAETPESLAQEKELIALVTNLTTLTTKTTVSTINFIKNAHGLVKRKSGDPYYTHPMEVVKILLEITNNPETILAGLLHDVVEDTPVTLNQVELMYSPEVAYIVDMVTHYNTNGYRWKLDDKENKSILDQCKDIRVIHVKLADRLHNTRTLCFRKLVDQKRIAKETMEFYIPRPLQLKSFIILVF